jgi:hypothetical protein
VHANSTESAPGSAIVAALDEAWQAVRHRHRDVPSVVIIIGSGRKPSGGHRLGYHLSNHWNVRQQDGRLAELFIAGEVLPLGGERILETMLHEAAHALADVRGIQDCSRSGNRYHNRRFAVLAAELGLRPPAKPSSSGGYDECVLEPETAVAYAQTVTALTAAAVAYLDPASGRRVRVGREGRRFAVACPCGRRLQVSPRSYEDGAIICGLCLSAFEPV